MKINSTYDTIYFINIGNKMKNIIIAVFVLALITGCASSHIGINANVPKSEKVKILIETEPKSE